MKPTTRLATALCTLLLAPGCQDDGTERPLEVGPIAPDGYGHMMVLMANAEVPVEMLQPVDGEKFHREIMGRDDEEYERVRRKAVEFFERRFGIEKVDDNPDYSFRPYQVEPFANYRVYLSTGDDVPPTGWEVRDGGWEARVINPDGVTLQGGQFDGVFLPPGTFMTFGDYNIKTDLCDDGGNDCDEPREIVIAYESRVPVTVGGMDVPDVVRFSFTCDLSSEEFGQGLGQGISEPVMTEGGKNFQYNVRQVMTFSMNDGF